MPKATLHFTEHAEDLEIDLEGVTVFVGPNNSGKSLVLREILYGVVPKPNPPQGQTGGNGWKVLKECEADILTLAKLEEQIIRWQIKIPAIGERDHIQLSEYIPGVYSRHDNLYWESVRAVARSQSLHSEANPQSSSNFQEMEFARCSQIHLQSRTRLQLVDTCDMGYLTGMPKNFFANAMLNDDLRNTVRKIVHEHFGFYLVFDPCNEAKIMLRLSKTEPPAEIERSFSKDAISFYKNSMSIENASDGLKAFTGIVMAVESLPFTTIAVDEPEAFLHPPMAKRLGIYLSKMVQAHKQSLLVATHSSDFLFGCLQTAQKINVVRLNYANGKSSGKRVDSKELNEFWSQPLVRSTNIMAGLFHDGVVVTESDNDRAFYSEIYYRLTEEDSTLPSLLFVNGQGKDTIWRLVQAMRSFGVPTASIYDIDVCLDGKKKFTDILKSINCSDKTTKEFRCKRISLVKSLPNVERKLVKKCGVELLTKKSDSELAAAFFDALDSYGLFAVRLGELEGWLKWLDIRGEGTKWTICAFEKLGHDRNDVGYVHPASGDVWDHLRNIAKWVQDPHRLGM